MSATTGLWQFLPPEIMEMQLSQIDLLLAMYPEDAKADEQSQAMLDTLRDWCIKCSENPPNASPSLSMALDLAVTGEDGDPSTARILQLDLSVPLQYEGTEPPSEAPQIRVRIRQPDWMSKAEVSSLAAEITEEEVFTVVEQLKDACSRQIALAHEQTATPQGSVDTQSLVRVWFYFPSINTRSKRDDLINHAPSYGLTGFLLAGKPGLLCLEGDSKNIDDYMKFIKTESWGDIPAHHKKVSERYRETDHDVKRVFADMQEITGLVGERRGERANRGDMKAVETWLSERGLGDTFEKVLM